MKYKFYIVFLLLILSISGCNPPVRNPSEPATTAIAPLPAEPAAAAPADHQTLIDPDTKLIYTKHARCRMSCRHISEADIREVLREGHINEAKSKQEPGRCPAYAVEDERNSDHIRLRIVFAKCDTEIKVVTCIDRDDEFACDCK
ncbi:MAG: DUF4258 domain-containing protein [Bacteroidetes bacterium]|nr:DUF4258 domain-containing protein [Bacteroidota bacterium]